jgi:hypothetical protein
VAPLDQLFGGKFVGYRTVIVGAVYVALKIAEGAGVLPVWFPTGSAEMVLQLLGGAAVIAKVDRVIAAIKGGAKA